MCSGYLRDQVNRIFLSHMKELSSFTPSRSGSFSSWIRRFMRRGSGFVILELLIDCLPVGSASTLLSSPERRRRGVYPELSEPAKQSSTCVSYSGAGLKLDQDVCPCWAFGPAGAAAPLQPRVGGSWENPGLAPPAPDMPSCRSVLSAGRSFRPTSNLLKAAA